MQKLIIAIVSNEDSTAASRALTKGGFSVTRLATTGGFLLSGNTTMLVGTDADRVDEAIHIIGENSCKRNKMVSGNTSFNAGMYANVPVQVTVGGATIFVIDVERYEKLWLFRQPALYPNGHSAAAPTGHHGAGRRPADPCPVPGGAQPGPAAGYRHCPGGGAAVPERGRQPVRNMPRLP